MARVRTGERGRVSVEELVAYRQAYGKDLGLVDFVKMVLGPAVAFTILSTAILYSPVISILFFIMGASYGYLYLMPKSIEKEYENESFNQRSKFINNMTQIMTDKHKTVGMAIGIAKRRAEGEFRDDLARLEAQLFGADVPGVQNAMDELADKYEQDIIFSQYVEQIETAAIEGNSNIDTLKDIKDYHNQMKAKKENFESLKQGHLSDMKTMIFTVSVFIIALTFSFGFDTYLSAFAHAWAGRISGGAYLMLMLFFFKQFNEYLFDDSVTSSST